MDNTITVENETFYGFSPLGQFTYADRATIYTIWTGPNAMNRYNLIYIGESGEIGTRLNSSHHKYQNWLNNNINSLWVAFRPMPTNRYTREQRLMEERRLINLWNPVCNS